METRMQQLITYMEQQSLDAMLITLPRHVYYLSGFFTDPHERFLGLVLPKQAEPFLLVPALDREAAEAASSVKKVYTHSDTDNPYLLLKKYLPSSMSCVGVEKTHLTVSQFEALTAVIGAEQYIDIEKPLRDMRVRKTPEEAARIKRAAQLIEAALGATLPKVKAGVTEVELVAELEYQMKKAGADGPSFSTMVLAGENSALPHGKPGTRKVQQGELLLFDCGVYAEGYASDITRTFAVGDVDEKLVDIYNTVLQANLAGIEAARPGVSLGSLDRAARSVIENKGYGEYFIHRLGHGLGLDVHEYPSIHGENEDLVVEGMVFTVEPGIYLPGHGGVRIEDDVFVTKDGIEILTSFPKELTVIG